jgi:hypothetical protein
MRILDWQSLSKSERNAALLRPALRDEARVVAGARQIIAACARAATRCVN